MIALTLIQGEGFVFSAADARVLREEHRITGSLIGSLPAHPHQNIHLGLPLQLSREEVTLLLELELAQFKMRNNYPGYCTASELSRYNHFMDESLAEQVEECRRARLEDIESKADEIVRGKLKAVDKSGRKKKEKKTKKSKGDAADAAKAEVVDEPIDPSLRAQILEDIKSRIQPLTASYMLVQVHNVNPFVNPHDTEVISKPCRCGETRGADEEEENEESSSASPSAPAVSPPLPRFETVSWRPPSTAKEKLRYAAFKHFWTLELYVTNGVKFGGDFLVYPGDPTRFHSFFVVQCVDQDDEPLKPSNLITLARLGTTVKKTLVLASFDDDEQLTLTSLEWSHWN